MATELFPGFADVMIDGDGAAIHCRIGGQGPAVLFLHGFPETHATWHRVAGAMAQRFTCVFADLRGYGASSVPAAGPGGIGYSKRAMASDMVAVMARLGHTRFAVVGHDRGARVAYRMALDHGAAVERLAVVDIVPTLEVWRRIDRGSALALHHWLFLAQPAPYPETFIAAAPDYFLEATLKAWSPLAADLAAFDAAVLGELSRRRCATRRGRRRCATTIGPAPPSTSTSTRPTKRLAGGSPSRRC